MPASVVISCGEPLESLSSNNGLRVQPWSCPGWDNDYSSLVLAFEGGGGGDYSLHCISPCFKMAVRERH